MKRIPAVEKKTIGTVIRTFRTALPMSQDEFAKVIGVRGSTVSSWERGESRPCGEVKARLLKEFSPIQLPTYECAREDKPEGGPGGARLRRKQQPKDVFEEAPVVRVGRPKDQGSFKEAEKVVGELTDGEKRHNMLRRLTQALIAIDVPEFRDLLTSLATVRDRDSCARLVRAAEAANMSLNELAQLLEA